MNRAAVTPSPTKGRLRRTLNAVASITLRCSDGRAARLSLDRGIGDLLHPGSVRPELFRVSQRACVFAACHDGVGTSVDRRVAAATVSPRSGLWSRRLNSGKPVEFLAFEADPLALVVLAGAESGRHHGHAAGRTDRWAVVSLH